MGEPRERTFSSGKVWSSVPREDVQPLEAKFDIPGLAKKTGKSESTLEELFRSKKIPGVCIDGVWLAPISAVLNYFKRESEKDDA